MPMATRLSKKVTIPAFASLFFLAAAVVYLRFLETPEVEQRADQTTVGWQTGAYDLQFTVANQFDLATVVGIASQQTPKSQMSESTMGLKGLLSFKNLDGAKARLWFENVKFDSIQYDGQSSHDLDAVVAEMRVPVELGKMSNGAYTGLHFSETCKQICQRVWGAILASMQVTRSTLSTDQEWQAQETNLDATLLFAYKKNEASMQKTLLSISEFIPLKPIESRIEASVGGTYLFDYQPKGIHGMNGSVEFAFMYQGSKVYSRKEIIKLRRAGTLPDEPQFEGRTLLVKWIPGALDAASERIAREDAWRRELGEENLDTLKSALERELGKDEEIELYKKIRAFLYFHPERSRDFLAELVTGDYNGNANRLVAVALGRVGHPEAQSTLNEAFETRVAQGKEALNFIPLLAQTENPSAATVEFLEKLSDAPGPHQSTAILAYGQVLGALATSDPQRAEEKLNRILDLAEESERRDVYYDAIGNSAQPSSFSRLKVLLEKETNMDALAIGMKALRRMNDPAAMAYLIAGTQHAQAKIQTACWESLASHPYDASLEQAAKQLLKVSSNEHIQLAALGWIWEHRKAVSDVKDLFEQLRKNDQLAPVVRQQAQSYADLYK